MGTLLLNFYRKKDPTDPFVPKVINLFNSFELCSKFMNILISIELTKFDYKLIDKLKNRRAKLITERMKITHDA